MGYECNEFLFFCCFNKIYALLLCDLNKKKPIRIPDRLEIKNYKRANLLGCTTPSGTTCHLPKRGFSVKPLCDIHCCGLSP